MFNQFNDLIFSEPYDTFVQLSAACTSRAVGHETHTSDDTTPVFVCQGVPVCVFGGKGQIVRLEGRTSIRLSIVLSFILSYYITVMSVYHILCAVGETETETLLKN